MPLASSRVARPARTAVARGSRFVRVVFVIVLLAFIVRIGGSVLGLWS